MASAPLVAVWERLRTLKPSMPASIEPSAAMFRRIRRRLTAWYTGILAIVLAVFAIAVYLGAHHAVLQPIDDEANAKARFVALHWDVGIAGPTITPCSARDLASQNLWACYATNGGVYNASYDVLGRSSNRGFLDSSIARSALRSGQMSSTTDVGRYGTVRRYFAPVINGEGAVIGVVEAGAPMGAANNALHNLLILILIAAPVALIGAAVGGAFLADRSLAPARLAYARQRNFVADASHELRTPLTLLRADADVLLRTGENLHPDQVELVEDMVAEASHMALLANNMLDLARLEAGDTPIEQEVIDLGELAENVTGRAQALAAQKRVTVTVEHPEPVLVLGDRTLLQQALLVLVDNAVKYNHEGGRVDVSVHRLNGTAILQVRDTGIGIEPKHLPHLGERFYRADASRTGEHSGAGLGIAIARTIAARHAGSLALDSEANVGTSATLSLPAA